jgi:hypothetical protein
MANYVSDEELVHRFTYHAPGPVARAAHEVVRAQFKDLALRLNEQLPEGRSKSCAFTALEEASFHAHAAIARDIGGTN